jgi:hypothetical protein
VTPASGEEAGGAEVRPAGIPPVPFGGRRDPAARGESPSLPGRGLRVTTASPGPSGSGDQDGAGRTRQGPLDALRVGQIPERGPGSPRESRTPRTPARSARRTGRAGRPPAMTGRHGTEVLALGPRPQDPDRKERTPGPGWVGAGGSGGCLVQTQGPMATISSVSCWSRPRRDPETGAAKDVTGQKRPRAPSGAPGSWSTTASRHGTEAGAFGPRPQDPGRKDRTPGPRWVGVGRSVGHYTRSTDRPLPIDSRRCRSRRQRSPESTNATTGRAGRAPTLTRRHGTEVETLG